MSLRATLVARIRQAGPMSVSDYMAACLLHPEFGYYAIRDPFGRKGDFTTAPEISQMFGELIGLCLAQCWIDQGRPPSITLAEAGPGRGTLMEDALRAARKAPGFVEAAQVALVEASPALREEQAARLPMARWFESVSDLPEAPLYFVANEFFDALPIRQFLREGDRWRERLVGLRGDDLAWGLGPPTDVPAIGHRLADTKDGDLVEHRPDAEPVVGEIADRIARHGGAALIADYGDWNGLGDTFQAVSRHARADPLADPGNADLTAHVDFCSLARACKARGAAVSGMTPQGVFLERLGITDRANALADGLAGDALDSHVAAHRRLTHPGEMGNLFKVIGITPAGAGLPPGLDPPSAETSAPHRERTVPNAPASAAIPE